MTTLPPPNGETPALSAEEIELLKRKPETTLTETPDKEVDDIKALTERLLSENLTEGVEIHETPGNPPDRDEEAPSSMPPERMAMTNRPPTKEDLADIHIAYLRKPAVNGATGTPEEESSGTDKNPEQKPETAAETQTAFCVEGNED